MLEHFRSMPLSEVCAVAGREKLVSQCCAGKAECNLLRSLPSMRRSVKLVQNLWTLSSMCADSKSQFWLYRALYGKALYSALVHTYTVVSQSVSVSSFFTAPILSCLWLCFETCIYACVYLSLQIGPCMRKSVITYVSCVIASFFFFAHVKSD